MKRTLLAISLLFALCVSVAARQVAARKFDEFRGINLSDLAARLDGFVIELQNDPTSKGVIVVYPEMTDKLPGWYLRRAYWAKGYMTKARGLLASRVSVINGGFRDKVTYELWLVPQGASEPVKSLDWAEALAREKSPVLFDSDIYENQPHVMWDESFGDYTDPKEAYEPFVSALKSDPASRGLIIAYYTRRNARGYDRKLAARKKLSIMKLYAIGADRITAVGGGLRKNRTIEYWIVPPGAELPKPSPDVRPSTQPKSKKR